MLNFYDKKKRMNLEKKIEKKQEEAVKISIKKRDEVVKKMQKTLDRIEQVRVIKAREAKINLKETLLQIKEINERDKQDGQRIMQLREKEFQDQIHRLEKVKQNRVKADRKNKLEQQRDIYQVLPTKIKESQEKIIHGVHVKQIHDLEKINKVHERNNYVDDKFRSIS